MIKKLYSITAQKEDVVDLNNEYGFNLIAKVLVDDGTYEAYMTIYNKNVKDIFKLSHLTLMDLRDNVNSNRVVQIYDRFKCKDYIDKNLLEELTSIKLVGYCLALSNVSKKVSQDTNYNTLFKNLKSQDENNLKDMCQNFIFINGDVITESFQSENYLVPKPLLKLLNYESFE